MPRYGVEACIAIVELLQKSGNQEFDLMGVRRTVMLATGSADPRSLRNHLRVLVELEQLGWLKQKAPGIFSIDSEKYANDKRQREELESSRF